MSVRAVVFEEAGRLELRAVTLREPGPDEVVVETAYSAISTGTERLLFNGALPGLPQLRYPLVPGYEAAGVVVEAGAAVRDVAVGDHVFVGGSMCYTDVMAAFGGQSSRLVKRADAVVPLNGIPLAHAPLLALAATALHGVRRLGEVGGERIAVLGLGAVGSLAAQFLTLAGAHVVAADRSADRLKSARAAERIDVSGVPLEEALTVPVRHAVEATGDSNEIARCARVTAPGGSILLLSYYDRLTTPFTDLFVKEATLLVSREWLPADLLAARDAAAAGNLDLAPLSGCVLPVERYDDAYRTAFGDPSIPKVILSWA